MAGVEFGLDYLWKEAKFEPNQNQEKAILHLDGPLYLPAGPGSGKTRVLLWRVVNLIVFHDVKPDEILLATFTEKAALQLREGLRGYLGMVTNHTGKPYDLAKMYVGTMHSLCRRILIDRRFAIDGRRIAAPVLMDELAQYLFAYKTHQWEQITADLEIVETANQTINRIIVGSLSNSRHNAVSNLLSTFNRFSEECLTPEEIRKLAPTPELVQLSNLYDNYRRMLEANPRVKRTDFALLQQKALDLLENCPHSGSVFKHVIVDEYQDTNTIQERLYFKLASGKRNLCVVGDDDQALYRFRGATVENFVEFPERCQSYFGIAPKKIPLSINYRSPRKIVSFYTDFISSPRCDWSRPGSPNSFYRVADKDIQAANNDDRPSVIASSPGGPEMVCEEIAGLVEKIIRSEKVANPNQVAFLYPSLKSVQVGRMKAALEARGLKVYAPRAGTFLEVEEAIDLFGMFLSVFGQPERGNFGAVDYQKYHDWMDAANGRAQLLINSDAQLSEFVNDRRSEIQIVVSDHMLLKDTAISCGWDLSAPYDPGRMRARLAATTGLSPKALSNLNSRSFERFVVERQQRGQRPFPLKYVINRATSLDWTVLDLFYRLCGFAHFKAMFDLAECGEDEGPICNLSLISQYLSRFMDEYATILTGEFLSEDGFIRTFFSSYLYALYRRGESEYEDAEDPFPKGRIPFLTIHQAKGLEFPVVVLGNPNKRDMGAQAVEKLVHPLLQREGEPLDRMSQFDIMRMFYVALSRAQNLLVIANYTGPGQSIYPPFRDMLGSQMPRIPQFEVSSLPKAKPKSGDLPKNYSYTGDYLLYQNCPRQYMMFRKYGFVPSRSQTMFFGSLVHQTLDDLHQFLIAKRSQS